MNNDELKHVGIMGMKWGHRKASSSNDSKAGDHRKTSFAKDADGRKVNRLFGKRNRTKLLKRLSITKIGRRI
jgi:hypothetical protein